MTMPGAPTVPTALRLRRAARLTVAVAGTAAALMTVTASGAHADPGAPGSAPALEPFDKADTRGIRISQYELSIDHGGFTNGGKAFWATLVSTGWEFYRWWIGMVAWLLDWAISFSWLGVLTTPIAALGNAIQTHIIGPSNLMTTLLVLAGVGVGVFVGRGHHGRAAIELGVTAVVFTLATTGLAHPVAWVTGPNGPLVDARNAGVELANTVTSNGANNSADAEALKRNTSAVMIDTFVRKPHQLLNYGGDIDSDKACVETYDQVLRDGPYGSDDSTARDRMGKCNKGYKKYADNPGQGQLAAEAFLMPAGSLLALMVLLMTVLLMCTVVLAAWTAIKLIWHTIVGLIPGTSRRGLARGLADLLIHVCMIPALTVFLAGYLFVLNSVMAASAGMALLVRYLLADLLLIVGMVVLWRIWRKHDALSTRFADMLTRAADAARTVNRGQAAKLAHHLNRTGGHSAVQRWANPALSQGMSQAAGPAVRPGVAGGQAGHGGARAMVAGRLQRSAAGRETLGVARDSMSVGKALAKYTAGAPVTYAAMADKWSKTTKARIGGKAAQLNKYADAWGDTVGKTASGGAKVGKPILQAGKVVGTKVGVAALNAAAPGIGTAAMAAVAVAGRVRPSSSPTVITQPDRKPKTRKATPAGLPGPDVTPAVVPDVGPRRPVQRRRAEQAKAYQKRLDSLRKAAGQ